MRGSNLQDVTFCVDPARPMVLAPIVGPSANSPAPVSKSLLTSLLSHALIADFIPVNEETFKEGIALVFEN